MDLLKELFGALDIVALQRVAAGQYETIGKLPGWFVRLYPECVIEDRLNFGGRFLFLENFLIDAEKFWKSDATGRIKSGTWIEVDTFGKERQLEASALNVSDHKILLIEFAGAEFQERQKLIQTGREQKLDLRAQKKMRRGLQKTAERYNSLVQVLPHTLLFLNDTGTCVDFAGAEGKKWIGKKLDLILPEEPAMRLMEKIAVTLHTGSIQTLELPIEDGSGKRWRHARIISSGNKEVLVLILDQEL